MKKFRFFHTTRGLRISNNKKILLVVSLFIVNTLLLSSIIKDRQETTYLNTLTAQAGYPELLELQQGSTGFTEVSEFFKNLSQDKGAVYAYNALKAAPLPAGTDLHLLGHVIGDELYKQLGAEGVKFCTDDFRNACSHSIVIGLFSDKGDSALPEIAQACQNAPGGPGAYTMCFHGLGHGILAYYGYDFSPTVAACRKTGTAARLNREFIECVGGSVMEIISGGGHDREKWEAQNKKYFSDPNPLSFCQSNFIPNEAKSICYIYITPQLFKVAGADLAKPGDEHFAKAFTYCESISEVDKTSRDTCFGGFGKEFVVLAKNRDIRNVESMTKDELNKVYRWCQLTPNEEGQLSCITFALNSLYWGGENDRQAAINFCNLTNQTRHQSTCFNNLISAVSFYIKDGSYRRDFCRELPNSYQTGCEERLL